MGTASAIINGILFFTTLAPVLRRCRRNGKWRFVGERSPLRYFTIQSNALGGLSALAMAVCQLCGHVPEGVRLFKYLCTASLTVTMLTVLFFLGPTQGFGVMLGGVNFFLHLVSPLLAIASFCFLEKGEMAFSTALLGVLPVLLYGLLYVYKTVCAPKEKRWEDFYGFNAGGRWPIACAALLLGSLAACALLWLL